MALHGLPPEIIKKAYSQGVLEKRQIIKDYLLESVQPYIQDGILDIKTFRTDSPYLAQRIVYYFGTLSNFTQELGVTTNLKKGRKILKESKKPQKATLTSKIALEYLQILRDSMTLDEIAKKYSVTMQYVQQLYNSLYTKVNEPEKDDNIAK